MHKHKNLLFNTIQCKKSLLISYGSLLQVSLRCSHFSLLSPRGRSQVSLSLSSVVSPALTRPIMAINVEFSRPPKIMHPSWCIYIYIYIRLKIKPNSVRIRFYSCQIFVLPSTGFEPTPLLHCSTIRLALRPAP